MSVDSMFIGVTGLEAYQNQIDVISNNIANVGTTGYKGQDVNFQDLLYQAQSYATGPTQTTGGVDGEQVGLGVKVGSIDTDFAQGSLETTGVNTNLALNGDGFFILAGPNASSAPVYTRNGDFSLNENGLLYDPSSGLAVQGYMADKTGNIAQTGTPGDITIPIGLSEQAMGTGLNTAEKFGPSNDQVFDVSMGGNLDQTQWTTEAEGVQAGNPGTGQPFTVSTTIYDSLGNPHLANITYTPDATGATPGTAAIGTNAALAGGGNLIASATGAATAANLAVSVNATGTQVTISDGTNSVTASPGGTATIDGTTVVLGNFAAADAGKTATITDTAGANGLPSQVANADGTLETPATRWKVSVSFADGTTFSTISNPDALTAGGDVAAATYATGSSGVIGYAYFDQNGQYINTASTIGAVGVPPGGALTTGDVHAAGKLASTADGNQLNIQSWGTGSTDSASAPTASGPAPTTGPIGIDFSSMTSLGSGTTSATNASSATVIGQNGYAAGILSNITVGEDGTITGSFTNGQTLTLGRVAVATFQNEGGLTRLGGSDFGASANSGLAELGVAGTGRYGDIVSGSLEQSNVSIADEFTKMIAAQNAYTANSKSITVADEDLQTVDSLIR
ncbi:MAG TPA: flagellar hook-basal body complex protein [Candidatus Baltobacteraceae bacterium]|nr:flagellar hook-basal body complex protein [Candidatus Baltobacteraceae bacterium]